MTEGKVLLWWVLFGGTHIGGSSVALRSALIRKIGLRPFKLLYSLVAFATFVPLCWTYFVDRHSGEMLFEAGPALGLVAQALMLLALLALAQSLVTPNPLSTMVELAGSYSPAPRGIQRITRHPSGLAMGLFGLAHCLANPFTGDWIFFGGFTVFAVLGAIHQDRRTLATGPAAVKEFQEATSSVPFAAILAGKQRLAPGEYNRLALLAGLVVFLALRTFHAALFGGFDA
jgi:uncharacterized membrane protein